MTEVELINNRLIKLFGFESQTGLAKYRIVRSEEQTEKRYGSYDILYHDTKIWMGTRQGLVEIKKYWYMNSCWLLERVEPNINRKDTFYDKYTYEPIFPFLDKDNNQLPLNWKVIEFIVYRLERAERKLVTESDHLSEQEKLQNQEEEKIYSLLDKPEPTKELPTFKTSTLLG